MKFLKICSIALSCFMVAASVQAMDDDEQGWPSSEQLLGHLVVKRVKYAPDSSKETAYAFIKPVKEMYNESERAFQAQEWDKERVAMGAVGTYYLSMNNGRGAMQFLEEVASSMHENVGYAHLLLRGVGIEKGEERQAKDKACTLLEQYLEAERRKPLDEYRQQTFKLLFKYLLAEENPRAVEQFTVYCLGRKGKGFVDGVILYAARQAPSVVERILKTEVFKEEREQATLNEICDRLFPKDAIVSAEGASGSSS